MGRDRNLEGSAGVRAMPGVFATAELQRWGDDEGRGKDIASPMSPHSWVSVAVEADRSLLALLNAAGGFDASVLSILWVVWTIHL